MVFVPVKVFRVVVLAKFTHLKNEKLVNVALKSPPLKNNGGNDYSSSLAKGKHKVWYRMLTWKQNFVFSSIA